MRIFLLLIDMKDGVNFKYKNPFDYEREKEEKESKVGKGLNMSAKGLNETEYSSTNLSIY